MKSARLSLDAIVIGAGMVGACAALAFARAGLRVAVVERQPSVAPELADPVDLRVVAIAPHAQHLLERLGVWKDIAAVRASVYTRMQVCDALGAGSLSFSAADYGWPALGHIVENRLVAGVLWRAMEAEPNVRLVVGDELRSVVVDEHGAQARLASGLSLQGKLLVGADGVNSKVREQLLIGVSGRNYGQSALVAHLNVQNAAPELAWQRFMPSGPLAFLPLGGQVSMVWTLPTDRANALKDAPAEQFEAQLQRASADQFGRIHLASERATFPLRLQIAQAFAAQRAILIGDAAHVVHPLAGQGVNLGFGDVSALLSIIDKAQASQRAPLSSAALTRWARERRSEVSLAGHAFDGLNRLYGIAEGPMVSARAIGLNWVNRLTPLKRKLAEHAAGIRAGHV